MLTRLIAKIETSATRVTSTTTLVTTTAVPPISRTNAATSDPNTSNRARPPNGNEMIRAAEVAFGHGLDVAEEDRRTRQRHFQAARAQRALDARDDAAKLVGSVRIAIIAYAGWPSGAAWRGLSRWS